MFKFLKINSFQIDLKFIAIIILAVFLRLNGLNWDSNFHLHPDERAITMFSLPLQFPNNWNPHFFAYGSFPLYLLRIAGNILQNFNPVLGQYNGINLVGRSMSAFFDIGTLILVFLLGKKLFSKNVGIVAAFFYAISVLPIQLSHFYAVDTILTFFILLNLYLLILFYEKPTFKKALLIGIAFGFALATKISATLLIVSIGIVLIIDFFLIFLKNPHRPKVWLLHIPKLVKKLFTEGLIIVFMTFITFIILEPYAFLDFKTFWQQTLEQQQMTYNAFTFPYTLQYVGKIPYLYELKNIFLFGQGPLLAFISFLGTLYITYKTLKPGTTLHPMKQLNNRIVIVLVFFWTYFFIVGNFAIGFMRYMLPLYPLFSIFSAVLLFELMQCLKNKIPSPYILNTIYFMLYTSLLVWPFSFINIYGEPNTRVLASNWIYQNIPQNASIAREHWDDGLPIGGNILYKIVELPIYDMQNLIIKQQIYQTVNNADYIIIASNRLYTPLQRIAANCKKWNVPEGKCTKNASDYYQKLFDGQLGFKKAAEFTIHPKLSFPLVKWEYEINDSSADESFTVYDHPKVMIFKNTHLINE